MTTMLGTVFVVAFGFTLTVGAVLVELMRTISTTRRSTRTQRGNLRPKVSRHDAPHPEVSSSPLPIFTTAPIASRYIDD